MHQLFDDTLAFELDRALDFYSLLAGKAPPHERRADDLYVNAFAQWLQSCRRVLALRVGRSDLAEAVERWRVARQNPIDAALQSLLDDDMTPRSRIAMQGKLWDAVTANWAAHEPHCPGYYGAETGIFVLEELNYA